MKYMITSIRLVFLALFVFFLANSNIVVWLGLFAVSLLAALIFGRIYCGYVCPMNTLMLPVAWLSRKLKFQTTSTPKWLKNGYFAWITLGVSIIAMLGSKRFLHINIPILPFWLVLSVLVTLRYKPAVFHNLICPFGALQKTFGRFARLSKKVDDNACVGCKLCENACPSQAIVVSPASKKAVITTALCHQCTSCQQICRKNAIHYSK